MASIAVFISSSVSVAWSMAVDPTAGEGVCELAVVELQPVMAVVNTSTKAVQVVVVRGEGFKMFP